MIKTETREKDLNPFVEDPNPFQTKNLYLHSEKGHFCLWSEHFMAWSISDKNEDKVQNL